MAKRIHGRISASQRRVVPQSCAGRIRFIGGEVFQRLHIAITERRGDLIGVGAEARLTSSVAVLPVDVCIADRGNRRIQVFDTKGTLLRVITIHEMAYPLENTLFVAKLLNRRVQKLILHP